METIEVQNDSEKVAGVRLENEATGNKLENLVYKKERASTKANTFSGDIEVHHDIGVMFIYQANLGILSKLTETVDSEVKDLYLETYGVYTETIRTLYNTYNSNEGGLRLDFVLLNRGQYLSYTGSDAPDSCAEAFLYFIITPCDGNRDPIDNKHYKVFNLGHTFDLNQDFIDAGELKNRVDDYKQNPMFGLISGYCTPEAPTEYIYYKWEDIKKIIDETNSLGDSYEKVEFVLGEVIPYHAMSNFFRKNPTYGLDEIKYQRAYSGQEKRLTVLGKYIPEEILEKEGYFDMGSLYP